MVSNDRSTCGREKPAGGFSRRAAVALPLLAAMDIHLAGAEQTLPASPEPVPATVRTSVAPDNGQPFERRDFGTVGIYDIDLLTRPDFVLLLDNFAASPRAFHGTRFFGFFTAGVAEDLKPESGGTVWDDPSQEPNFAGTFDALHQLTSRGLTPFVAFGFFPQPSRQVRSRHQRSGGTGNG